MERIREAVEQARKKRAEGVDNDKSASVSDADAQAHVRLKSANEVDAATAKSDTGGHEHTRTRCISVSPAVREENRLVAAIPDHPLLDHYRMLRTRVLQEMRTNDWRVLAVTSPAPARVFR